MHSVQIRQILLSFFATVEQMNCSRAGMACLSDQSSQRPFLDLCQISSYNHILNNSRHNVSWDVVLSRTKTQTEANRNSNQAAEISRCTSISQKVLLPFDNSVSASLIGHTNVQVMYSVTRGLAFLSLLVALLAYLASHFFFPPKPKSMGISYPSAEEDNSVVEDYHGNKVSTVLVHVLFWHVERSWIWSRWSDLDHIAKTILYIYTIL